MQSQQFDWLGGMLAVLGFGGIVFALIESMPVAGAAGAIVLIALLVLGSARIVANGSTPAVPFPQFQRSESPDLLPLLGVERRSILFPTGFDTGSRLFGYRSGGGVITFHFVDVPFVTLVRRTSRSLWR